MQASENKTPRNIREVIAKPPGWTSNLIFLPIKKKNRIVYEAFGFVCGFSQTAGVLPD
jgi:hypothetical protein